MTDMIVTLTARGPKRILSEGGSQAWRLNITRARRKGYLVCVQNRHGGDWGGATEPHGTAFLIGRISEIVPAEERPNRWLIKIDGYTRIAIPDVWQRWHYPVRYMALEQLGIDPKLLKFSPVLQEEYQVPKTLGDVIEAAKQQIAFAAGVPNSSIRISVDLS